jgi:hypothetical protein
MHCINFDILHAKFPATQLTVILLAISSETLKRPTLKSIENDKNILNKKIPKIEFWNLNLPLPVV